MKKPRPMFPRGVPYDTRTKALIERLGINVPLGALLTGEGWAYHEKLWAQIGKALLSVDPFEPEKLTLELLWAEIGMHMAEEHEPEFAGAPGRPRGTKGISKQLKPFPSKDAARQRRSRARKSVTKN
jgi:hypothetical protein